MQALKEMRYPRWLALALWPATLLLGHAGLPAALSNLTPHIGWTGNRPGSWNLLGLLLVIPGFLWLAWCGYLHFTRTPRTVEVVMAATPDLITEGPYRWSRNPMYVGGFFVWLGWTIYYGSLGVLAGLIPFWSAIALLAVPAEEDKLETLFGEGFREYKREVPRWIGRSKRANDG